MSPYAPLLVAAVLAVWLVALTLGRRRGRREARARAVSSLDEVTVQHRAEQILAERERAVAALAGEEPDLIWSQRRCPGIAPLGGGPSS